MSGDWGATEERLIRRAEHGGERGNEAAVLLELLRDARPVWSAQLECDLIPGPELFIRAPKAQPATNNRLAAILRQHPPAIVRIVAHVPADGKPMVTMKHYGVRYGEKLLHDRPLHVDTCAVAVAPELLSSYLRRLADVADNPPG